jgi:hypothetical protein
MQEDFKEPGRAMARFNPLGLLRGYGQASGLRCFMFTTAAVYAATREDAEAFADAHQLRGPRAREYHADLSMTVALANCSALGVFRFDWTSHLDGATTEMSLQWGAGMALPLAFRGGVCADVRNPGRFGFDPAKAGKGGRPGISHFKAFAQAFADAFEEDE